MTDRVVIFLHLPKAAGSTLNRVIARQYPPESICKTGGKTPQALAAEIAAGTRAGGKVRLIAGHHAFGMHTAVAQPSTYITVLRDPVERMISHFHYARKLETHPLHEEIASGRLTLADAARQTANLQTRYLASEPVRGTADSADERTLASAKENLAQYFSVVGFAERFDETLILLGRRLGWSVRPVAKSNVTRGRPKRSAHSPEDLAAVRAANGLDCALYDWARARFDKEIAGAGLGFRIAVGWLQARNRALQFGASLTRRATATPAS